MIKLLMHFLVTAALILIIVACDNYSHNSIVNTPPANYVNLLMLKTYGGGGYDWGTAMVTTPDKEQIITGATSSNGLGPHSLYMVKSDSLGNFMWNQFYGGWGIDIGEAVALSPDSNLIFAGMSSSFDLIDGHKLDPALGDPDPVDQNFYLVKTDMDGLSYWEKVYGDTLYVEWATAIATTSDGYLIAGYQSRYEVAEDFMAVMTDLEGNLIWQKTFGTGHQDRAYAVVRTPDGNFVLGGYAREAATGPRNPYFVKIDPSGTVLWERIHGAAGVDETIHSMIQTSDGGLAAVGKSGSALYVVRMDASGSVMWQGTYAPSGIGEGRCIAQTAEGDFIVCGQRSDANAIQIAKINAAGQLQWGDASGSDGYGLAMLPCDGGYLIAGSTTYPSLTVLNNALLIKIEEDLTNVE